MPGAMLLKCGLPRRTVEKFHQHSRQPGDELSLLEPAYVQAHGGRISDSFRAEALADIGLRGAAPGESQVVPFIQPGTWKDTASKLTEWDMQALCAERHNCRIAPCRPGDGLEPSACWPDGRLGQ